MTRGPKKRATVPKPKNPNKSFLEQMLTGSRKPNKAKKALSGLAKSVALNAKVATNPHKIAEAKIGKHLRGILSKGSYLKSARIDGTTKDVLNARNEEEAVDMVNDLVANFEHYLKNNPNLFKELGKPIMFHTTFKEMLIHTTEDGNYYWDIDVVANGDDVKVAAPLRIVG